MNHKAAVMLKYGGFCLLCVMLLIGVYIVSSLLESGRVYDPVPRAARFYDPPATCSFPDHSFCETEQKFRKLVAASDGSGILESQESIALSCSSTVPQPQCVGSADGLTVQVFNVEEGSSEQILTRNQYIDYFRSYFAAKGPFLYSYEKPITSGAILAFMNKTKTDVYILKFQKLGTTWFFVTPQVKSI